MKIFAKNQMKLVCFIVCTSGLTAGAHAATPVSTPSGACWNKPRGDVQVSAVDWPATWSGTPMTASFQSGYTNAVRVGAAGSFTTGPGTWSGAVTFSAPMSTLSGRTLPYMDQRANNTVTYTFQNPLTHNEAMLVLDVDSNERTDITFFDSSDNPIDFSQISAAQIRSGNNLIIDDSTPTIFSVRGNGAQTDNPTWAFSPIGSQTVSRVVVSQRATSGEGTWDTTFVHATCAADQVATAVPVPSLGGWALTFLSTSVAWLGLQRRRKAAA